LPRQNGPIGRIDRVLAMQIPVVEQAPSGAGGSDWNMMLAHDYTIVPPMTEHFKSLDGYKGMVTVTVVRTVGSTDYEHTLRADFKCVAPDLYDYLNR
jgi:hypothetical protein